MRGKSTRSASRPPNGGKIVETLVSLLKKSGARDVKPVSLEIARLPDEALNAAEVLFRTKAKEALDADPKGKILGRIVDEHHAAGRRSEHPGHAPVHGSPDEHAGGILQRLLSWTRSNDSQRRPGPTAASSWRASAKARMS